MVVASITSAACRTARAIADIAFLSLFHSSSLSFCVFDFSYNARNTDVSVFEPPRLLDFNEGSLSMIPANLKIQVCEMSRGRR